MTPEAWISLGATLAVFILLQQRGGLPADWLFLSALAIVTLAGALTPTQALLGFANPALITIAALFVVAEGMRSTGALDWVGQRVLGSAREERTALARLAWPTLAMSAFLNNTPIVAMLAPIVADWCRKLRVSPSRLLLPISYLAILGGTCTLIGTSTNLVIAGMMARERAALEAADPPPGELLEVGLRPMHLFEIGYVGLPCAALGAAWLVLFGRRLLPDRADLLERLGEQRREYLVEMLVLPECRLIGQTVEAAGLRHLPGLFLIEIDRDGETITPVAPEDVIRNGDRLIFTGVVTTIADLEKIPGLVPAADMTYEVHPRAQSRRRLAEVVLSGSSPLIGATVREAGFRQHYNAAVVAVSRGGRRVTTKIGDIRLEPGDTLLVQARSDFIDNFRHSRDFSLVASLEGPRSRRYDRAWISILLLGVLVLALSVGPLLTGESGWTAVIAMAVAAAMVVLRCLQPAEARTAIDLQVLLTIGGALGLGLALTESGAVATIAGGLIRWIGPREYVLLIVIYLLTLVSTEMITNTAVAALMFPLALAVAVEAQVSPRPFIMGIAIAASCSFVTPIGYQTNLMVMGPGGYEPRDYLKAGLPLTIIVGVAALTLIPLIWPFAP